MANAMPPSGQPSPQQIAALQQQMAIEAQKRGMTPQQFQQMQRQQLEADAKKAGLTFEQYINQLKQKAFENHQKQQLAQQTAQNGQQPAQAGQPQQGQQVPITPGAPDPRALALAQWLRGQNLKTRTSILNGQRKDMFKVKRALRAIESPEYKKASIKKKSLLPELTESMPPTEIFKLLPLSLLALRVSKIDPHEGHDHGPSKPAKRTKGLWTVKIEQQQDINPDLHYIWLYDGPQWRMKLYATGALVAIMAVVMFPLWPVKMRIGVWYLSMAMLGCIGLFFLMAIFRLILFVATVFTIPPGLWLYPNLFEDVGFFDSFRPIWGWQEDKKAKKKAKAAGKKPSSKKEQATSTDTGSPNATETADAKTSFSTFKPAATINGNGTVKRNLTPRVEEVDEDDGT